MSGTRWVILDDTDPSITYTGPWYERSDGFDSGNWGLPYGGSQHGTNGSASFSFTFSGTRLRVLGTSAVRSTSTGIDPNWNCIVGGTEIEPSDPWTASINNWPLCESPAYTPGQYTLTLNSASTEGANFWFDQIRYQPLANMSTSLTNPTVILEQSDPSIQYVSGKWENLTASAMLTLQAGSVVTAKFTGTKLTWVGWTPSGYPTGASQATYSINGAPAVTFQIRGLPSGSATLYNQHLFETPELPFGEHTLTVTHNGPSAPLTIDHLLVKNGDILLPNSPLGNDTVVDRPDPSGALPDPADQQTSRPSIAAIAGGSVGGAIFLVLCALGAVLFLRWRKRRKALSMAVDLDPLPLGANGFPSPFAQVTPYGYANNSTTNFTKSMHASSQTNLNASAGYQDQGTGGWPPASRPAGYTPIPFRRDQKTRTTLGAQVPVQQLGSSPPPSDFSSSSDPFSSRYDGDDAVVRDLPRGNLLHHQDSGIRLTSPESLPEPLEVIEVPPSYTPG